MQAIISDNPSKAKSNRYSGYNSQAVYKQPVHCNPVQKFIDWFEHINHDYYPGIFGHTAQFHAELAAWPRPSL
mgnify:CR=1 FL=1